MKTIIVCFVLFLGFFYSCKKCETPTLIVTNPYNQSVEFYTVGTGKKTIAPNSSEVFQQHFYTEFAWTASRVVTYADGSNDRFYGSGVLKLSCGEVKNLIIECDALVNTKK